jgi:CheY-like chemotaxis protein
MAKKLLLADDSITIQKVVELVLSEEDFQIKSVNNGQDALTQIGVFKPDIVLADIEMPQINGYQLCEKIKQNQATSHIPVILLAGAFEPLNDELAKKVGADGYIIKPFESQELISKVNAALTSASLGMQEAQEVEVEVGPGGGGTAEEISVVDEGMPAEEVVAEAVSAEEEDLWAMEDVEISGDEGEEAWDIGGPPEVGGEARAGEPVAVGETEAVEEREAIKESRPGTPIDRGREEGPALERFEKKVQEMKMPSEEAVIKILRDALSGQVSEMLGRSDLKRIVEETASAYIRESIDAILRESLPGLLEKSLQEMLKGSFSSLNKDIENIIWETVPDLAENLIKREIERIKAGF